MFLLTTAPRIPLLSHPNWAQGQTLDWLAVAMGTFQGCPDAGTSLSALFWDTDVPNPFTPYMLTEVWQGLCRVGGGALLPEPSRPSPHFHHSAF